MINFPTQILDFDSHRLAPLDLFISSNGSICSTVGFISLENFDYVVFSVSTH